jgi:hypothetical protein
MIKTRWNVVAKGGLVTILSHVDCLCCSHPLLSVRTAERRPCVLCPLDQISIEELDIIYKIPHCVPISAHHKWNFDDLLEKMWEYLKLVRMYVSVFAFGRYAVVTGRSWR